MAQPSVPVQVLLNDYTDTLSSLPTELTRSFSDLRELDAVLRSSIESITRKIMLLTSLIENEAVSPSERLILILDIADDAQRLKMGSEDKIRVAGKACEELVHTRAHVNVLLTQISMVMEHFSSTLSVHQTTYPHVAPSSLLPVTGEYSGRRKRMPASGPNLISARDNYPSTSPNKKRRLDDDNGSVRTGTVGKPPKLKEKVLPPTMRTKPKQPSGEDASLAAYDINNGYGPARSISRNGNNNGRPPQLKPNARGRLPGRDADTNGSRLRNGSSLLDVVASRGGGRGTFDDDDYASSIGPSTGGIPMRSPNVSSYANENGLNGDGNDGPDPEYHGSSRQRQISQASLPGASNSSHSNSHQPSSRAAANRSRVTVAAAAADEYDLEINGYGDGEVEGEMDIAGGVEDGDLDDGGGDVDDRKYCYCDRTSFGEMIACDDNSCEREWFHLGCIALAAPPKGSWYCDTCQQKRDERGAKSRARGGGRGGGKRPKGRGAGGGGRGKSSTAGSGGGASGTATVASSANSGGGNASSAVVNGSSTSHGGSNGNRTGSTNGAGGGNGGAAA